MLTYCRVQVCLEIWSAFHNPEAFSFACPLQVVELLWNVLELAPDTAAAVIHSSSSRQPSGKLEAPVLSGQASELQAGAEEQREQQQQQQQLLPEGEDFPAAGEEGLPGDQHHKQLRLQGGNAQPEGVEEGPQGHVCSADSAGGSTAIGALVGGFTSLLQQLLMKADSRQVSRGTGTSKERSRSKGRGVALGAIMSLKSHCKPDPRHCHAQGSCTRVICSPANWCTESTM